MFELNLEHRRNDIIAIENFGKLLLKMRGIYESIENMLETLEILFQIDDNYRRLITPVNMGNIEFLFEETYKISLKTQRKYGYITRELRNMVLQMFIVYSKLFTEILDIYINILEREYTDQKQFENVLKFMICEVNSDCLQNIEVIINKSIELFINIDYKFFTELDAKINDISRKNNIAFCIFPDIDISTEIEIINDVYYLKPTCKYYIYPKSRYKMSKILFMWAGLGQ